MRKFTMFAAILGVLAIAGCNNSNQGSGAAAPPTKPIAIAPGAPPAAAQALANMHGVGSPGPASAPATPAPSGN